MTAPRKHRGPPQRRPNLFDPVSPDDRRIIADFVASLLARDIEIIKTRCLGFSATEASS